MNALRDAISTDIAGIVASGTGGVDLGGVVTVVNVPANRFEWTDSGVVCNGMDGLVMHATGEICHNSTGALYGPETGAAELRAVIVADGTTPSGDTTGEISYRVQRSLARKTGRLWLRVRDVGGGGDNPGSFNVAVRYYADLGLALAPLADLATLRGT